MEKHEAEELDKAFNYLESLLDRLQEELPREWELCVELDHALYKNKIIRRAQEKRFRADWKEIEKQQERQMLEKVLKNAKTVE